MRDFKRNDQTEIEYYRCHHSQLIASVPKCKLKSMVPCYITGIACSLEHRYYRQNSKRYVVFSFYNTRRYQANRVRHYKRPYLYLLPLVLTIQTRGGGKKGNKEDKRKSTFTRYGPSTQKHVLLVYDRIDDRQRHLRLFRGP